MISPDIHIVIVGPLWVNAAPPGDVYRTRDVLSVVAADSEVDFVDPLELRWFFEGEGLIGEDGVHPTGAGQIYLAERLTPIVAPIIDEVASNSS
jgi:lysophospholipase L1-like esterase